MTAPLGSFVLVHDDGRGLRFLRPHNLGRRERLERPSLACSLAEAFIFPSAAHARVALEIARAGAAGWPDELEVRELALAGPAQRRRLYDLELVSVDGGEPCTWRAFRRMNVEIEDRHAEIEHELVTSGRYVEPAGGAAGFTLELVRPVVVDGAP